MSSERPLLKDILNAIDRQAAALEQQCDYMAKSDPTDYGVEFPATDAELLRAAHALLSPRLTDEQVMEFGVRCVIDWCRNTLTAREALAKYRTELAARQSVLG